MDDASGHFGVLVKREVWIERSDCLRPQVYRIDHVCHICHIMMIES